jgi:hypothetical protein
MVVSRATRAPVMRPVFARVSSAASGLRFCGMMELPVVNASDSRMKPKGLLHQRIISSAKRERCMAQIAQADRYSSAKSRSDTASSELSVGPSKPRVAAVRWRSIGKLVPARAALPRGQRLRRARASERRPRSRESIST